MALVVNDFLEGDYGNNLVYWRFREMILHMAMKVMTHYMVDTAMILSSVMLGLIGCTVMMALILLTGEMGMMY